MQSIISLFHWQKEYSFFDKDLNLQTINLNLFQRGLRFCGFYSETHLANVSAIAQANWFKPDSNWSPEYRKKLFHIIDKASTNEKLTGTLLGIRKLVTGETVEYSGKVLRPDMLSFNIRINRKGGKSQGSLLMLYPSTTSSFGITVGGIRKRSRGKDGHVYVEMNRLWDKETAAEGDLLNRVSYLFLAKLLKDSTTYKAFVKDEGETIMGGDYVAKKFGFKSHLNDSLILTRDEAIDHQEDDFFHRTISLDFMKPERN